MSVEFFANYKEYLVFPDDDKNNRSEEFVPQTYEAHYIVTLSLMDSLVSSWADAVKLEIDMEESLLKVIDEWNRRQKGTHYIQLLEINQISTFIVLALSFKSKVDKEEELSEKIDQLIQREFTNSLFVGERWYTLVGDQGKKHRRLFQLHYKEYIG